MKDKRIHIAINENFKNKLKDISERERRSITDVILIALEEKYPELKK